MTAVVAGRAGWAHRSVVVAGASAAATVAGLLLALVQPSAAVLVQGHLLGDAVVALAAAAVGATILTRMPGQRVGLLFAAVGAADAAALLTGGLQAAGVGGVGMLWAAEWTWRPGLALPAMLPLTVPDGPERRPERVLSAAGIAVTALWTVAGATTSRLASGPHSSVPNPLGVPGADSAGTVLALLGGLIALVGIASLVQRIAIADRAARRRLLPIAAAGVLLVAAVAASGPLGAAGPVVQDLAVAAVPVACLTSVLRLRLYDVEVAVGRTAGWIALTALLAGAYVAVVQLCASLLRLHGTPAGVAATAAVAVAFAPLHALMRRIVDRAVYGERGAFAAVVAEAARLLAAGETPGDALSRAAGRVAAALRCPGVRVVARGALLAGPAEGAAAVTVPLTSGGAEVGVLEVLPRGPGERFGPADERLLAAVAPALATAVVAAAAAEDAAAARVRLAVGREAERRRVRERLHDDVGPALAAVAVQAQTALKRLERGDTAGATAAVDAVRGIAADASADLRQAVDELGPRAVDERGLADAVAALAASLSDDRLVVSVEVDQLPGLPAAVEQAAYRIAAEALTNVRRHAGASRAAVTLRVDGTELRLRVEDDGVGLSTARRGGVGLASMRARAEELGGAVEVDGDAGVRVRVRLPLTRS